MTQALRFYSFVPGLYISELQKGLQTGHAISEMHADLLNMAVNVAIDEKYVTAARRIYDEYCRHHKTIVILNALNSAGVEDVYAKLAEFAYKFKLPFTIFHEDQQSLNGAATATGIIVPERFFAAVPVIEGGYAYTDADGNVTAYADDTDEAMFIALLKGYRLA